MRHLDYLRRQISVGDQVCMLYPLSTLEVRELVDDGTLIATTEDGARVRITRPTGCTIMRGRRAAGSA